MTKTPFGQPKIRSIWYPRLNNKFLLRERGRSHTECGGQDLEGDSRPHRGQGQLRVHLLGLDAGRRRVRVSQEQVSPLTRVCGISTGRMVAEQKASSRGQRGRQPEAHLEPML